MAGFCLSRPTEADPLQQLTGDLNRPEVGAGAPSLKPKASPIFQFSWTGASDYSLKSSYPLLLRFVLAPWPGPSVTGDDEDTGGSNGWVPF